MSALLLFVVAASAPAPAASPPPPFGIKMGAPLESLGVSQRIGTDPIYRLESAPVPHQDFPRVSVVAFPETGVCEIIALTNDEPDNQTGEAVKIKVEQIARGLDTRYGTGLRSSRCFATISTCSPANWTLDLASDMRVHEVAWGGRRDAVAAGGFSEIRVNAFASSGSSTFVMLRYKSTDRKGCAAAERADRERLMNKAVTPP
jgi:hypothetical protein